MNMNCLSKRASEVQASEVRELLKLTQNREMISFGGGLPAEETFPIEQMKDICTEVLNRHGGESMQYAVSEGYPPLRKLICELMKEKGVEAGVENLLVTSGSQQGLDLSAKVFLDEGDTVLCESPTYLSAINAFKPFYPKFAEVDMDEEGLIPESLEEKLKSCKRVKFLYTVPDYQNPTGRSMSAERRKTIVELANRYDIVIIEDNPYSDICFSGNKLPPLKSFDTQGRVIYISTFSKTVCPGFRIGWVCASKEIINKYILFKQGTDLHTNIFSQMQVERFYRTYDYKKHIKENIHIYKNRKDTMINEIKKNFPTGVRYTNPDGGLFLWVTLPENINSKDLLVKAMEQGVAFVTGGAFYPNGGHYNTLRLNFSGVTEDKIIKGIGILGKVIKDAIDSVNN